MPVLNKPIITEKSLADAKNSRFTFGVAREATKTLIKKEIERMFEVKVTKIQTARMPGKSYRTGKKWIQGQRNDWKKAVVTLKQGQKIDLFDTKTE